MPLVTVLMPVYNAGPFLKEAVHSILTQSHKDIDFLIVDDGSDDPETQQVIRHALSDARVRVCTHSRQLGLPLSLNDGLELARGEYIARMDADDISHPQRLERQIEFLSGRPEIGLCGTAMECFGEDNLRLTMANPQHPEEIKCGLLLACVVSHPTVMFRHNSIERFGLRYNPEYELAEDYELWTRCCRHFPIANLKEPLLRYRVHRNQSSKKQEVRKKYVKRVIQSQWDDLELSYSPEELNGFCEALHCPNDAGASAGERLFTLVQSLFSRIISANEKFSKYEDDILKRTFTRFWMTTMPFEERYGWDVLVRFLKHASVRPAFSEGLRLLVKCGIRWEARDPRRLI